MAMLNNQVVVIMVLAAWRLGWGCTSKYKLPSHAHQITDPPVRWATYKPTWRTMGRHIVAMSFERRLDASNWDNILYPTGNTQQPAPLAISWLKYLQWLLCL